jgi:hypothetical protein
MLFSFLGTWFIAFLASLEIYGSGNKGMKLMFTFTLGSFASLIVWGIASGMMISNLTETYYQYKEVPIKSIKNDREIYGDFFIGCGTVQETEYYYFFEVNEHGRYERNRISVYNAEIEETNSKKPCIAYPYKVKHVKRTSRKNYKLWMFNWEDEKTIETSPSWGKKRILYVPKGTILTKYELY